jgi:hypothetical protein
VQYGLSNPAKAGATSGPIYKRERGLIRSRVRAGDVCLLALSLTLVVILSSWFVHGRLLVFLVVARMSQAASFSPSFCGVVWPVLIRHRSTANRRARATIAFFLADRCVPDSTAFHCNNGRYPG